jgi:hypothetical protein
MHNKITITEADQRKVEEIRTLINESYRKWDAEIEKLSKELNLSDEQALVLWDYVFNDSNWMIEVKKEH